MKKLILTSAIAFSTMFASAQNFMVVTGTDPDPNSIVTPRFIGETYIDTSNNTESAWIAVGTANNKWKKITV